MSLKFLKSNLYFLDKINLILDKLIFHADYQTQDIFLKKLKSFVNKYSANKIGLVRRTLEELLNDHIHIINIDDKWFSDDIETYKVQIEKLLQDNKNIHDKVICIYRKDFPQWLMLDWNTLYSFSKKDKNNKRLLSDPYIIYDNNGEIAKNGIGDHLLNMINYMLYKFHPENWHLTYKNKQAI